MQETTVYALAELFEVVDNLPNNKFFCFRGQAESGWGLVPTVFRGLPLEQHSRETRDDILAVERDLYRLFREKAARYVEGRSDWEVLCFAQHYGTPTRLLDWTTSLFVATFFAVSERRSTDASVWCVNVSDLPVPPSFGRRIPRRGVRLERLPVGDVVFLQESTEQRMATSDSVQCEDFMAVIQPPDIDDRIKNQGSVFSVHVQYTGSPSLAMVSDQLELLLETERRLGTDLLWKVVIPAGARDSMSAALRHTGVSFDCLFPDLVGIGQLLSRWHGEMMRNSGRGTKYS